MVKSKLTSEELKELYLSGRTIQELVPLAGISKVAIWKRLHQLNTPMRPAMTGRPWAKTKRGSEFIGSMVEYGLGELGPHPRGDLREEL